MHPCTAPTTADDARVLKEHDALLVRLLGERGSAWVGRHVAQGALWTREHWERGEVALPDIALRPLPEGTCASLRRVWGGVYLLARCRFREYPNAPFPLARSFMAGWCGVGERQAGAGVRYLEEQGIIARVARIWHPQVCRLPTAVYLPAGEALNPGWRGEAEAQGFTVIVGANAARTQRGRVYRPLSPRVHREALQVVERITAAPFKERDPMARRWVQQYRGECEGCIAGIGRIRTAKTLLRYLEAYRAAVIGDGAMAA